MPAIEVFLFAGAAAEYGAEEATAEGGTVAEALEDLLRDAPERARTVVGRSSVLLNGAACRDHARTLDEGDRLDVLPPFAGG